MTRLAHILIRWSRRSAVSHPLLLPLLVAVLVPGCVHRRMTIVSDPPGAMVLLEGEEVGLTPCSVDFTYYGTREFTLVKDGYETLTVNQKVPTPWYQVPPVEFFSDNLALRKINDRHTFLYKLKPQTLPNTQELLNRASGVRSQAEGPR